MRTSSFNLDCCCTKYSSQFSFKLQSLSVTISSHSTSSPVGHQYPINQGQVSITFKINSAQLLALAWLLLHGHKGASVSESTDLDFGVVYPSVSKEKLHLQLEIGKNLTPKQYQNQTHMDIFCLGS